MEKEMILARLSLLRQQYENQKNLATQAHNILMAYDGAIQEANYWLVELSKEAQPEEKYNTHTKRKRRKKDEAPINTVEDEKETS